MTILLICQIFVIGFFGNLLTDYQILPPEAKLISELSVYLLFCYSLINRSNKHPQFCFHLLNFYFAFLLIAISSAFLNGYMNQRLIIGLRPILRFYFFYLALLNLNISENQYKKINKMIFVLFILQLPASAIRFQQYGISELTIGTYASHGGGLTPVIPIVALGFLSGFYIFWKPKIIY
jgi:hypothetical protein